MTYFSRCPECGPFGNEGRIPLFNFWHDCSICGGRTRILCLRIGEIIQDFYDVVDDLNKCLVQIERLCNAFADIYKKEGLVAGGYWHLFEYTKATSDWLYNEHWSKQYHPFFLRVPKIKQLYHAGRARILEPEDCEWAKKHFSHATFYPRDQ